MNVFVISLMAHYITTAPWLEINGNQGCKNANALRLRIFSFYVYQAALMRHLGRTLN